jgi:hypothetical protein
VTSIKRAVFRKYLTPGHFARKVAAEEKGRAVKKRVKKTGGIRAVLPAAVSTFRRRGDGSPPLPPSLLSKAPPPPTLAARSCQTLVSTAAIRPPSSHPRRYIFSATRPVRSPSPSSSFTYLATAAECLPARLFLPTGPRRGGQVEKHQTKLPPGCHQSEKQKGTMDEGRSKTLKTGASAGPMSRHPTTSSCSRDSAKRRRSEQTTGGNPTNLLSKKPRRLDTRSYIALFKAPNKPQFPGN